MFGMIIPMYLKLSKYIFYVVTCNHIVFLTHISLLEDIKLTKETHHKRLGIYIQRA